MGERIADRVACSARAVLQLRVRRGYRVAPVAGRALRRRRPPPLGIKLLAGRRLGPSPPALRREVGAVVRRRGPSNSFVARQLSLQLTSAPP